MQGKQLLGAALALLWVACGTNDDTQTNRPPSARDSAVQQTAEDTKPNSNGTQTPQPPEPPSYYMDDSLRLNELQMKGTHNSYHVEPADPAPDERYTMPSLTEQLELYGVRAFELDLHYFDGEFWVYHLPVDDDETTCPRLTACLAEIRAWSEANPGHHPLVVYFDFRDTYDSEKIIDHLDELDAVLAAAWPAERLLTPDDVVGASSDLAAAVRDRGWPALGAVRGKTMFVMWSFGDAPYRYSYEGTSLAGRKMFIAATYEGWRHAMVLGMDTAQDQEAQIRAAVQKGYFVRTRADDQPGRGGDFPARRDAALRSGAQVVLTDYPAPDDLPGYSMELPGGTPSRCNPVRFRQGCTPQAVENPVLLR